MVILLRLDRIRFLSHGWSKPVINYYWSKPVIIKSEIHMILDSLPCISISKYIFADEILSNNQY